MILQYIARRAAVLAAAVAVALSVLLAPAVTGQDAAHAASSGQNTCQGNGGAIKTPTGTNGSWRWYGCGAWSPSTSTVGAALPFRIKRITSSGASYETCVRGDRGATISVGSYSTWRAWTVPSC